MIETLSGMFASIVTLLALHGFAQDGSEIVLRGDGEKKGNFVERSIDADDVYDTRFGFLSLSSVGHSEQISLNDEVFHQYDGLSIDIDRIDQMGAGRDVALISEVSGGSFCWGNFRLVTLEDQRVEVTEPFAECEGDIIWYHVSDNAVEIVVAVPDPSIEAAVYRFDGQRIHKKTVEYTEYAANRAGAGSDVTRWSGRHPRELFRDESERLRFLTIMSRAEMFALARHVSVGNSLENVGDYVLGSGCVPHNCHRLHGAVAIRKSDGQPFAVMIDREGRTIVFGGTRMQLPPSLRNFVDSGGRSLAPSR